MDKKVWGGSLIVWIREATTGLSIFRQIQCHRCLITGSSACVFWFLLSQKRWHMVPADLPRFPQQQWPSPTPWWHEESYSFVAWFWDQKIWYTLTIPGVSPVLMRLRHSPIDRNGKSVPRRSGEVVQGVKGRRFFFLHLPVLATWASTGSSKKSEVFLASLNSYQFWFPWFGIIQHATRWTEKSFILGHV